MGTRLENTLSLTHSVLYGCHCPCCLPPCDPFWRFFAKNAYVCAAFMFLQLPKAIRKSDRSYIVQMSLLHTQMLSAKLTFLVRINLACCINAFFYGVVETLRFVGGFCGQLNVTRYRFGITVLQLQSVRHCNHWVYCVLSTSKLQWLCCLRLSTLVVFGDMLLAGLEVGDCAIISNLLLQVSYQEEEVGQRFGDEGESFNTAQHTAAGMLVQVFAFNHALLQPVANRLQTLRQVVAALFWKQLGTIESWHTSLIN